MSTVERELLKLSRVPNVFLFPSEEGQILIDCLQIELWSVAGGAHGAGSGSVTALFLCLIAVRK